MTSAQALERRLQRLEEENNTLKRTVRHQEGEISRLQVRGQQERGAQQARALAASLRELQTRCEGLEDDLARANQRLAAFQHETFTLRSLVKLVDHPHLADAARAEAERLVTKEELRVEREAGRALRRQCEAYRTRAVEACETAEAAAARVRALEGENAQLRVQATRSAPAVAGGGPGLDDSHARLAEMEGALAAARIQCAVLAETVEVLRAERSTHRLEASSDGTTPLTSTLERTLHAASTADNPGQGRSPAGTAGAEATGTSEPAIAAASGTSRVQRLRRLRRILKAENDLLTRRVAALSAQNHDLITGRVRLEEELVRLQHASRVSRATASTPVPSP